MRADRGRKMAQGHDPCRTRRSTAALGLILGLAGCESPITLSRAELLDPAACQSCHPSHFREWSGSMHAYASDDPVFVAMNARGQRETGGALGDFCVRCHAPMALRSGATRDGLNLGTLPAAQKGVTCYFCHQITSVGGAHNNPLTIAEDEIMRGAIRDPITPRAHRAAYSMLHDRQSLDSAATCGSCHDVLTPAGVHLERTFAEWQGSLFAMRGARQQLTCGQCHMPGRSEPAADLPGAPVRVVHDHKMPGVDLALTPFPELDAQRQAVQRDLNTAVLARLCVARDGGELHADVTLDNVGGGHDFPSGATHDRRAWVELRAFAGSSVVFESGTVADGQAATDLRDPKLWLLRERVFDGSGRPAHMFWDIARYETEHLPPAVTSDPRDPRYFHAVTRAYSLPPGSIDRVTLRVRIRPIDYDVLADLVRTGDLSDEIRAQVSTFDLAGTMLEWRKEGPSCVP
ncbi:MAG: hypothetical protein E6Q99_04145 [Elusimicrobia bacterium]|nr:MAG: hypothetical protein E6Q99_04145 [Elusimicrobiota bacterium]